jgi:hypothetical protein
MFILVRFGVLAVIVVILVESTVTGFPLTQDFSTWYAGSTMFALTTVLVLAPFEQEGSPASVSRVVEAAGVEPRRTPHPQQLGQKAIAQNRQNRSKCPVQVQNKYSSAVVLPSPQHRGI